MSSTIFFQFYAVILTVFAENGGLPLLAATNCSPYYSQEYQNVELKYGKKKDDYLDMDVEQPKQGRIFAKEVTDSVTSVR